MWHAEIDKMGMAYYANNFVCSEVGWVRAAPDTWRQLRELETTGVMLPVIETHCEFREVARYNDELEIATKSALLSPAACGVLL